MRQKFNPLRVLLLLIGVLSLVINFILLIFVIAGSQGVAYYMGCVAIVSMAAVIVADVTDRRRNTHHFYTS